MSREEIRAKWNELISSGEDMITLMDEFDALEAVCGHPAKSGKTWDGEYSEYCPDCKWVGNRRGLIGRHSVGGSSWFANQNRKA